MDVFGKNWENHHERLRENWLKKVTPEDTVIIAGDISWGLKIDEAEADLDWISALPGKKIITKGNHDLWWNSTNRLNGMYEDIVFLQNSAVVVNEKTVVCGTRGWICPGVDSFDEHDEKLYRRELLRLERSLEEGKASGCEDIIGVLHYPPTNDRHEPSGFTELMEKYNVKNCIYGHLHGTKAFAAGMQGTVRGVRYNLVSLDYLKCNLMQLREF